MTQKTKFQKIFSISVFVRISLLLFLVGCRAPMSQASTEKMVSINIIDRNGMSETISSKDRIAAFQETDFLAPQPYQKVLRVYGRDKGGNTHSVITSYHPNGQIKQSLEGVNNRAYGKYREWFANGQQKIACDVIGGIADINSQAEQSWLFDGCNRAWDEDGTLQAEIYYSKGSLEGSSYYYHNNGEVWKHLPYSKNSLHGTFTTYLDDGSIFQTIEYKNGLKEGPATRFWKGGQVAYEENYVNNSLTSGSYFDLQGSLVAEIVDGNGFRAIFGKEQLTELHEYTKGKQAGLVKIFDGYNRLIRSYSIIDGEKHGQEIDYYSTRAGEPLQQKLLITWNHGLLQGAVQSWYPNGNLESRKEMSHNKKNGILSAWYENGALMLVEEYENDRLIKGQYYRMDDQDPISHVKRGEGVATLFSPEGIFSKKVTYHDGKPLFE